MFITAETIVVPDALRSNPRETEQLYRRIANADPAMRYVLDMRAVDFIAPYGVVALVTGARRLHSQSGYRVRIDALTPAVHSYLHRIDLFAVARQWLYCTEEQQETWSRNPHTTHLLELTPIAGPDDVTAAISRAESIFAQWLRVDDLSALLRVLSELCANIYQHSDDPVGYALMQKYDESSRGRVTVDLAVGDCGRGVRGSLAARHGESGANTLVYLQQALDGRTARVTGRGGLGLRLVEQLALESGGYLWLRSESAGILRSTPGRSLACASLPPMPGTQVTVRFHAPLPR